MAPPAATGTSHVPALDGLRGVAATIVLIGHAYVALTQPEARALLRESPAVVLINGHGAVYLFFILSAFCLAASVGRARTRGDLTQYFVRRVFRIHPPYMAALLLAWLASFAYTAPDGGGGLSPWFLSFLDVHLPPSQLLAHLAFPSSAGRQLPPAWSMTVEMIFALLLPALVWLSRRTHWSLLLLLTGWWLVAPPLQPFVLRFGFFFATGLCLYELQEPLARGFARCGGLVHALLVLAGLVLFGLPAATAGLLFRPEGLLLSAAGSTILIACALWVPAVSSALSRPAVVHHGRISYSFYLLHFTVLLLLARFVRAPVGAGGAALFLATAFVLTTLGADLAWRLVERPSIRLGNAICRRVAAATGGSAQLSRLAR